jgi:hypothetical protein
MSGHDDGGLQHRIASGQAGGKQQGTVNTKLLREDDTTFMHGKDVKLAESMDDIIRALASTTSSGSSGGGGDSGADHGRGGGADAISTAPMQQGPSVSMVDLVGGRNRGDSDGGRGI